MALARASRRTLVLAPFEYYENQAQEFANAFRATASGQRPLFIAWSELFDIEQFRDFGVDAVDFRDAPSHSMNRAILQTGSSAPPQGGSSGADAASAPQSLDGVLHPVPCKPSRDGIQRNMSFESDLYGDLTTPSAVELYGRRIPLHDFACGVVSLQAETNIHALAASWGDAPLSAIFNVGHHVHTRVSANAFTQEAARVSAALRPNVTLEKEARRFLASLTDATPDASVRVVAVHWRHGDYVAYKLLQSVDTVAARTTKAFDALKCTPSSCRIFLMTNCRDRVALDQLAEAMPTPPIRYTPSEPRFEHEGRRLVIEASVASLADSFVASQRSAVSELVENLRRGIAWRAKNQPQAKAEL